MTTSAPQPASSDQTYEIAHLTLVPKRHIGRMVAAALVLAALAALVRAFSVGQI
jgi:polar amino acid transport system permease protein